MSAYQRLASLLLWAFASTVVQAAPQVYYYHNDHLGTPQVMTDANQAVVWQADYEPFGQATVTTEAITNPLRFPGQYFDAETGLHQNWRRDYDPAIGRYLQSDPIGLEGGLNTYAYVEGNPLRYTDPRGLLLGGTIDAGESYGDSAAQYWADRAEQTGNPLYHIPGALAALWTPCTSDATALTLAGGYATRVLGPFSPRGVPKPLARIREYIRFDRPHHGKGWEWDGKIPKWIRDKLPAAGVAGGSGNDCGCK